MSPEFAHFIYSLYPNQGYGVTAATPELDNQRWRAFCAPLPVDFTELEKLGEAFTLQRADTNVVFSRFTADAKDEFGRSGIFSHNIIVPITVFLDSQAWLLPLVSYFLTDISIKGNLSPLIIKQQDLMVRAEPTVLAGVKKGALERIIECALTNRSVTLVCPGLSTTQMLHLFFALIQLLPQQARILTFITAPLGRSYRQARSDDAYNFKLVPNRSIALTGTGEYVDISQESDFGISTEPSAKAAAFFAANFRKGGYAGLKEAWSAWDKAADKSSDSTTILGNFIRDIEIENDAISAEAVFIMWKKGKKQEAKEYARTIIDKGKWGKSADLIQLSTVLLQDSKADMIKNDIAFILGKSGGLSATDRSQLIEDLIKKFPKVKDLIISAFARYRGNPMLAGIKDITGVPSMSSLLTEVKNYEDLRFLSEQVLSGGMTDASSFQMNLKLLLTKVREKYTEQGLDFIQFLLITYPERRSLIAAELVKEDFLPNNLVSRMPREIRQQTILRSSQIVELLKICIAK